MKDMELWEKALLGFAIALGISACIGLGSSCTTHMIYSEAKRAGVGEYYIDGDDQKQWRWKGAK